jgi:hypothetical protein
MFENVLPNLLTKLVFHVEKKINTVSCVDVETNDTTLSQYHSNCRQLRQHVWKWPGFDAVCLKPIKEGTHRQIYTVSWIVGTKPLFSLFFKHCASKFNQSFTLYTAVYQQQQTGYGAHLDYCRMGIVSLWWERTGWCVALAIHKTLEPSLKEEYSYTSTPPFTHHVLFQCKPYILAAKRLRGSLF